MVSSIFPTQPNGDLVQWFQNPQANSTYRTAHRAVLNEQEAQAAFQEISSWPGYAQTPLLNLPGLAAKVGVASVQYKDEGGRFRLGSFKALGGAYAVYQHLAQKIAQHAGAAEITSAELASGKWRDLTKDWAVCCATDGNHGRSVAWGAQMFGCCCVIYLHENVSPGREAAIAHYGAETHRMSGNYDDSVRQAAEDAEQNGWTVISDTSYEGYTDIPRDVMHGYTVMVEESVRQLDGTLPTHILVQGGVGGVAAAVFARFWWEFGGQRPNFVIVEPEQAACLYESARAGKWVQLTGNLDTVMAGLSCGEPSLLAWEILKDCVDGFLTLPDSAALDAMRLLAAGVNGDVPVVAGESAVPGVSALLEMAAHPDCAPALGLNADSRILVFGTEGDSDPELYREIVGRTADEVRQVSLRRFESAGSWSE